MKIFNLNKMWYNVREKFNLSIRKSLRQGHGPPLPKNEAPPKLKNESFFTEK